MNSEYPRVRVRCQDDDDDDRSRRSYLESLPGIRLPYLDDLDSLVSESEDDSPPSVVRIPSSPYNPRKNISTIPSSKKQPTTVKKNSNQKKSEEFKPSIRASSVPRPRAVLSSADNDAMIGSTTTSRLLLPGMKHCSCQQNRHVQPKLIPKGVSAETPKFSRKETTYPASAKTSVFGERKGRTTTANPTRRARLAN